jgi:hypothetical protein
MSIRSIRNRKSLLKEIITIPLEFRIDNNIENQKVLDVTGLKCYYCFSNYNNYKLESCIFSDLEQFQTIFYSIKIKPVDNKIEKMISNIIEKEVEISDYIFERVETKFLNIKMLISNFNDRKSKCSNKCTDCRSEPIYLENIASNKIQKSDIQIELASHNHLIRNTESKLYSKSELAIILEEHYNKFHSKYLNQSTLFSFNQVSEKI